jgi:hypothetical protein
MSQGDASRVPASSLPGLSPGLPDTTPVLAAPPIVDGGLCARFAGGTAPVRIALDVALPGAADADRTRSAEGGVADRILVAPGRGAVVEAVASPGATGGARFVVTDLGVRYPVPTVDVLALLGYGAAPPVRVPASLVALVPAGPARDPAAARAPAAVAD